MFEVDQIAFSLFPRLLQRFKDAIVFAQPRID
jgi:hypothetical protein